MRVGRSPGILVKRSRVHRWSSRSRDRVTFVALANSDGLSRRRRLGDHGNVLASPAAVLFLKLIASGWSGWFPSGRLEPGTPDEGWSAWPTGGGGWGLSG